VAGLDHLRAWRALTARPLVAIGGITLANSASVIAAGADAVALIGALVPDSDQSIDAGAVRARMETWLQHLQ
jgi:thiamine-phosphate pyrophosphorylase